MIERRMQILSACFGLIVLLQAFPVSAQTNETEIPAVGEICAPSPTGVDCFPFQMTIPPSGGTVDAYVEGASSYTIPEVGMSIGSSFTGYFAGTFDGGDGGQIGGEWEITSTLILPAGIEIPPQASIPTTTVSGGSWQGQLFEDGTGTGTYSGSDSMGMPIQGTWYLNFDAEDFQSELPMPTEVSSSPTPPPEPATQPTATSQSASTPTLPLAPDITPVVSMQSLVDLIYRQRTLLQTGIDAWRPSIATWFGGQLVSVSVDEEDQPFVVDVYGQRTPVDEQGLPLTEVDSRVTPSEKIIKNNPDIDWGAQLEDFGERSWSTLQNLLQPGFDWFNQTVEGLKPSESLNQFVDQLNTPVVGQEEGLTEEESVVVQNETILLQTQEEMRQDCTQALGESACEGRKLDLDDPSDYAIWRKKHFEDSKSYYFNKYKNVMSDEEWDELLSQDLDPVQVMKSRSSMNSAMQTFNKSIGDTAIEEIEKQFGIDRNAADRLKADLERLGADPKKADELARATQCLRVLSSLAAEHTISNEGMLKKIFGFVDRMIVRKQAQDLMGNNLDNNLEDISEEQLDLIQRADRQALVEALTAEQPVENDPVMQLVLDAIQGGQQ